MEKRNTTQSAGTGKFMDDVVKCAEVIKNGGLIIYPTDTVWAIGCDATNENAVSKIYQLKKRSLDKPLNMIVDHPDRIGRHVKQLPDVAIQLIEVNDKPMTIIYPGAVNIAANIISDDGSCGIRISNDEFCRKLISTVNRPVICTSASFEDEPSPENFREIDDEIKSGVDYIVKYRQNDATPGETSSIIKVGLRGEVEVIRQ